MFNVYFLTDYMFNGIWISLRKVQREKIFKMKEISTVRQNLKKRHIIV